MPVHAESWELNFDGTFPKKEGCECCLVGYSTVTATASHKWTKEEIEAEIIYLAGRLANSSWYDRGNLRRRLKHWTDKLDRYYELKSEFKN